MIAILEHHDKQRRISRQDWGLLALLMLLWLGFAVRALTLDAQGLWRDEVDALLFAQAPLEQLAENFTRPGWNGPFYFLLLRGWIALTGETAFALRYFALLCGVLSIPVGYCLSRRLLGRDAGLLTATLLTFAPYLVWYAQDAKMYAWMTLLALLACYALERACVEMAWRWWWGVLVATTLAFYSHILAALLIPVLALWFLLHPRRAPGSWMRGGVVLALLTLPYVPLLLWQFPLLMQVQAETGYPNYTLRQMIVVLLNGWSTGITGWGGVWAMALYAGVALLGALTLLLRAPRRLAALWVWLTLPLLGVWTVSVLRGPLFTDRYLIWSLPAFLVLIAVGLDTFKGLARAAMPLLIAVLLLISGVNLARQAAQPIKPQFREAAAYLVDVTSAPTLLLYQIPYNQRMIDYYAPELPATAVAAPFTNWRTPEGGYEVGAGYVDTQLRALTADARELWLVYSEVVLWDERELVKNWLDIHGTLVDEAHFHRVDLYHYTFP